MTSQSTNTLTPRRQQSGFTLIEVIVVVAIIGIMLSVVSFRFAGQSPAEKLHTEAQRMKALMEIVLEEALLKSNEYGMRFTETYYEFMLYDQATDEFTLIEDDNMLKKRELPEEMSMELDAEGLTLDDMIFSEEEDKPHVFLYSSGEVSPAFTMTFRSTLTDISYTLATDGVGKTEIEKIGSDL